MAALFTDMVSKTMCFLYYNFIDQPDLIFPYALILNELIAHVCLVVDYNMLFVLLELSNTIVMTSVPSPTSAIRGF